MKPLLCPFLIFFFLSANIISALEIKSVRILDEKGKDRKEFLINNKFSIIADVQDIERTNPISVVFNIYNSEGKIIFKHTEEPTYINTETKNFSLKNIEIKKICLSTGEYILETIVTQDNKTITSKTDFRVKTEEIEQPKEILKEKQPEIETVEPVGLEYKPETFSVEKSVEEIETEKSKEETQAVSEYILPESTFPVDSFPEISSKTDTELFAIQPEIPSKEDSFSKLKNFLNKSEKMQIEGYKIKEIYNITQKKFAEIISLLEEKKAKILESGLKPTENILSDGAIPIATSLEIKGKPLLLSKGTIRWKNLEKGQFFYSGDLLRTDKNSLIGIIFDEGAELKMNSNTEIVVLSTGSVKLRFGSIWIKSKEFNIQTSVANISSENSELVLALQDKLYVQILKGTSKVENEKGSEFLKEKESLTVTAGDKPSKPEKISKIPKWQNRINFQGEKNIKMVVETSSGQKIKFQILLQRQ